MNDMNLQPHLGRFENNYKADSNVGYLALAKVVKVHHKHNTVDVMIVKTNDAITSGEENEGRFAARVAVSTAHFNRELMSASGVIEPIQEGQLVILAFLDGLKAQPIILGSFHDTQKPEQNVLPGIYPLNPKKSMEDYVEATKYLRVFPSQMYHRVDGVGGVEVSHPSKTFFKLDNHMFANDTFSDKHMGFDHEDLEEKDPSTTRTRSGLSEESIMPVSMLFVHRSNFDDEVTTWTKFFLDQSGMFRVTRDNRDNKLTYKELTEEGEYLIRRQQDSAEHGQGQDYTQVKLDKDAAYKILKSKQGKNTSIGIDKDGAVKVSRTDGTTSSIEIDKDNNITLKHASGSYIKMDANGDIIIQAQRHVRINEGG